MIFSSKGWLTFSSSMLLSCCIFSPQSAPSALRERDVDVVVYGATSAGVAAAVQVSRMGRSVLLIEPGGHVGGLSAGGLGATDSGNKSAIGGIARGFYQRLGTHYAHDDAWKFQSHVDYLRDNPRTGNGEMWFFEPHVAEAAFVKMLAEANVRVLFGQRLDLKQGVRKEGNRIRSIVMESGAGFRASMFIDATYEGDLMALAGVSYAVGREANSQYDETLNGVQTRHDKYHNFEVPIDPYIIEGDPASGLLPGVQADGPGNDGEADRRIQAYNFRMCLTNVS